MASFILRRLAHSLLVIIGVTLLSFTALHMGGDPTFLHVSERATDAEIARAREILGFDKPLHIQYLNFLWGLMNGDLGNSLTYKTPALAVVLERLPATIELTLAALFLAVVVSVPLGVLAAVYRGKGIDWPIMTFAMLGQSVPSFWFGIMMILAFGLGLGWFPISGHVPFLQPLFAGDFATAFGNLPSAMHYLFMPALTVSLFSISRNARLVRSSMLEVLGQDYVRTARAKGLGEWAVIIHHALRNAWIPVVTMIGLEFGFLLSGVTVVETIFSWPGVGRLVYNAINQRDIPLVQAAVVVFSLTFVLLNLIVDVVYARLDPRVRMK